MCELIPKFVWSPVIDLADYLECNFDGDDEVLANKLLDAFKRVSYVFLIFGVALGITIAELIILIVSVI